MTVINNYLVAYISSQLLKLAYSKGLDENQPFSPLGRPSSLNTISREDITNFFNSELKLDKGFSYIIYFLRKTGFYLQSLTIAQLTDYLLPYASEVIKDCDTAYELLDRLNWAEDLKDLVEINAWGSLLNRIDERIFKIFGTSSFEEGKKRASDHVL